MRSVFILSLFFLLASSAQAQTLACEDLFPKIFYVDSRFDRLTHQVLAISQRLAHMHPTWLNTTERMMGLDMRRLYRKMVALQPLPINHPGALFVDSYFYPEFFWEEVYNFSLSTIQVRPPILSLEERNSLRFERTSQGVIHSQSGQLISHPIMGIFVIGLDGHLYIAYDHDSLPAHFKHSSFFAGTPVLYAGFISILPSGKVDILTDQSGHYQPKLSHFHWVIRYLGDLGFSMTGRYSPIMNRSHK